MSNMSYCRFHNTRNDMDDCIEAINYEDISSESEKNSAKIMFKRILNLFVEQGVVEPTDELTQDDMNEAIEEMVNSAYNGDDE